MGEQYFFIVNSMEFSTMDVQCHFGVQKLVYYTCSFGISVNTSLDSFIQWLQLG